MKLKSITYYSEAFIKVWKRFPITLIAAYTATIGLILFIQGDNFGGEEDLKIILSLSIAALLLLAGKVWIESHELNSKNNIILRVITVVAVGVYYYFLQKGDPSICFFWITIGLIIIGHLLVSFIPFVKTSKSQISFRSYNYKLFLNFIEAAIYTLVLFATLSLAVLALEKLFNFDISDKSYLQFFVFLAGAFHTTYFLSKFPINYEDEAYEKPAALRVFSEFIMIPIVCIYGLILYAYLIKIIKNLHSPMPWVKYLVTGFLILGIFTYLINYYFNEEKRTEFTKFYVKYFFIAALPVALLLGLLSYQSYSKSGIDNESYLLGISAIWIIGLTLYILISRRDDMRWIPLSLTAVSFLAFLTPIGICNTVVKSQLNKLESNLTNAGYMKDNMLTRMDIAEDSLGYRIRKSLRTLDNYNELDRIRKWDANGLLTEDTLSSYGVAQDLNINNYNTSNNKEYLHINNDYNTVIDISNFDALYPITNYNDNLKDAANAYHKDGFIIVQDGDTELHRYNLLEQFTGNTNIDYIEMSDESSEVKIYITDMSIVSQNGGEKVVEYINGSLLYRKK